jgi:hypothetical protein
MLTVRQVQYKKAVCFKLHLPDKCYLTLNLSAMHAYDLEKVIADIEFQIDNQK